jgi:hypothetical protein
VSELALRAGDPAGGERDRRGEDAVVVEPAIRDQVLVAGEPVFLPRLQVLGGGEGELDARREPALEEAEVQQLGRGGADEAAAVVVEQVRADAGAERVQRLDRHRGRGQLERTPGERLGRAHHLLRERAVRHRAEDERRDEEEPEERERQPPPEGPEPAAAVLGEPERVAAERPRERPHPDEGEPDHELDEEPAGDHDP